MVNSWDVYFQEQTPKSIIISTWMFEKWSGNLAVSYIWKFMSKMLFNSLIRVRNPGWPLFLKSLYVFQKSIIKNQKIAFWTKTLMMSFFKTWFLLENFQDNFQRVTGKIYFQLRQKLLKSHFQKFVKKIMKIALFSIFWAEFSFNVASQWKNFRDKPQNRISQLKFFFWGGGGGDSGYKENLPMGLRMSWNRNFILSKIHEKSKNVLQRLKLWSSVFFYTTFRQK